LPCFLSSTLPLAALRPLQHAGLTAVRFADPETSTTNVRSSMLVTHLENRSDCLDCACLFVCVHRLAARASSSWPLSSWIVKADLASDCTNDVSSVRTCCSALFTACVQAGFQGFKTPLPAKSSHAMQFVRLSGIESWDVLGCCIWRMH
jgi:hypothetical protein